MADAERLVAARPRAPNGRRQIGWVQSALHDSARALEAFNQAIELAPEDPVNYRARSYIHYNAGRTDERIADLTRAIELDPRNLDARRNLESVARPVAPAKRN